MIGFHGQRPVTNWLDAIKILPKNSLVLSVDDVHMLRDAKNVNSQIKTVFRKHADSQPLTSDLEDAKRMAREYFDSFIDGTWMQQELWRYVDYIKERNEYVATSQNEAERQLIITWLQAVTTVWNEEYRGTEKTGGRDIPLVCLSTAIGNDIDVRYARIVTDSGNVISYHNYTHYIDGVRDPEDWRYHSGRWAYMDAEFVKQGIFAKWMSTEGGPYNSVTDGWKSHKVLNGDLNRYIDECVEYQLDHITEWNKNNDNRYLGGVLFTFGNTGAWDQYELNAAEMVEIAKVVKTYEPAPVEPPVEPPENNLGLPRVQYKRVYYCMPQETTLERWLEVCREAFDNKRTVGFSYDDAGIGALDDKHAIIYDVTDEQLFVDWYNEHYPGTQLEFRNAPLLPLTVDAFPSTSKRVTQHFGENPDWYKKYGYPGHNGIDLAAPMNSPIFAAWGGTVYWASNQRESGGGLSDYGYHVKIAHGNGLSTLYAHLSNDLTVNVGETVSAGRVVGYSGNTGFSTAPHLHFEIRLCPGVPHYRQCQRDPMAYLESWM